jgi:hypothetical protein
MAASLIVRNPIIYAYHRAMLAPLRDLLHPDGSPLLVRGDLRVARSPIELISHVEKGTDLLLLEEGTPVPQLTDALRDTCADLMKLIDVTADKVKRLQKGGGNASFLRDPVAHTPQLQILAERMMQQTRACKGAGMAAFLRAFPFRSGLLQTASLVVSTTDASDDARAMFEEAGVQGIIVPGSSRAKGLDIIQKSLIGHRAAKEQTVPADSVSRGQVDRRDRLIGELVEQPEVIRKVVMGNGGRPDDFGISIQPVLKFLKVDVRRVLLLMDGGVKLPDGSMITKASLRREFRHHPTTAQLVSAIKRGAFKPKAAGAAR